MTNSHTKILITAASALLLVFSGCKKDEDESYTFRLETSSLDFEWGQTKEIAFTAINIKSFGTPTVPEGWTCHRDGKKYVITAPAQGGIFTGKIDLPVVSGSSLAFKRTLNVAVRIAREISVSANSIIISRVIHGAQIVFRILG